METQQVYIDEKNTAYRDLKTTQKKVNAVQDFAETQTIVKGDIAFKIDGERLHDLRELATTIKDEVVAYAFNDRILGVAKRQLNAHLKDATPQ